MRRQTLFRLAFAACLGVPLAAPAATTRTHVSAAGSDANTVSSCDYAHPCRSFAAALTVTTPGGEILALDSAEYGRVVVDRSVSIIAAPAIYAGIDVDATGNATGIEIATAGVDVLLRGLAINGEGGSYGINMSNGARLLVERCIVSGFSGGYAISVTTAANARILDSRLHDNGHGVRFSHGAGGVVADSHVSGGTTGILVTDGIAATTRAMVAKTVIEQTGAGVTSQTSAGGTARVHVSRSVVARTLIGVRAGTAGSGTAYASVSNSQVTGSVTGLAAEGSGAKLVAAGNTVTRNETGLSQSASAVLESAGTNTVRNNTADSAGTIASFTRM